MTKTADLHADLRHARTVPADLAALRYSDGYVTAEVRGSAQAEAAVRALADAGFDGEEMILASDSIASLRPFPDREAVLVTNPMEQVRASGRFGGAATGAGVGALGGVAVAFLMSGPLGVGAGIGAAVGAYGGIRTGNAIATRMAPEPSRSPALLKHEDSVVVGIGFEKEASPDRWDLADSTLRGAGLTPTRS